MSTWNEDFPIKQSQEHQASRREFTKFLGIGVSGFCSAKVLEDHLFPGHVPKEAAPMKVAESGGLNEIQNCSATPLSMIQLFS